jgi:hypothetical protein
MRPLLALVAFLALLTLPGCSIGSSSPSKQDVAELLEERTAVVDVECVKDDSGDLLFDCKARGGAIEEPVRLTVRVNRSGIQYLMEACRAVKEPTRRPDPCTEIE